jgi:hypothetical protein
MLKLKGLILKTILFVSLFCILGMFAGCESSNNGPQPDYFNDELVFVEYDVLTSFNTKGNTELFLHHTGSDYNFNNRCNDNAHYNNNGYHNDNTHCNDNMHYSNNGHHNDDMHYNSNLYHNNDSHHNNNNVDYNYNVLKVMKEIFPSIDNETKLLVATRFQYTPECGQGVAGDVRAVKNFYSTHVLYDEPIQCKVEMLGCDNSGVITFKLNDQVFELKPGEVYVNTVTVRDFNMGNVDYDFLTNVISIKNSGLVRKNNIISY